MPEKATREELRGVLAEHIYMRDESKGEGYCLACWKPESVGSFEVLATDDWERSVRLFPHPCIFHKMATELLAVRDRYEVSDA